jgi:hypothetical protein
MSTPCAAAWARMATAAGVAFGRRGAEGRAALESKAAQDFVCATGTAVGTRDGFVHRKHEFFEFVLAFITNEFVNRHRAIPRDGKVAPAPGIVTMQMRTVGSLLHDEPRSKTERKAPDCESVRYVSLPPRYRIRADRKGSSQNG